MTEPTAFDFAEKATYPKQDREIKVGSYLLTPQAPKKLPVNLVAPVALPCTTIVIHGVNDVGVGYGSVEAGLCAGLETRLGHAPGTFVPARYRMPTPEDAKKVEEDPDAVFFKRQADTDTHSPVIPFYWGFREVTSKIIWPSPKTHGETLDRYTNRLDKDGAKEGGPFANATTTLPDMWNSGHRWIPSGDPLRAVHRAPGRMYMVLAAHRLAALVMMIQDWHPNETINLVAHSQGTLLSLLAQAYLMQWGRRPADTAVLCNSPYSLEDSLTNLGQFSGAGEDERFMTRALYKLIEHDQTLHARLQTLVNIVHGVQAHKGSMSKPALAALKDGEHHGVVGTKWEAGQDRDNRGKVYLYFTPQDMTVGFVSVQGIGWQGVPNVIGGKQVSDIGFPRKIVRRPLSEIGPGFYQRIFTTQRRPDPIRGDPVLVGTGPTDFRLSVEGEDFFAHEDFGRFDKLMRVDLQDLQDKIDPKQHLWRHINAEALPTPVEPDLKPKAVDPSAPQLAGKKLGAWETIDPIDAAIASAESSNYQTVACLVDDPRPGAAGRDFSGIPPVKSPAPDLYADPVVPGQIGLTTTIQTSLNAGKNLLQTTEVVEVYVCLAGTPLCATGQLLVIRKETPEEMRLRQQTREISQRSFHSAIWASAFNHQHVTAYDVAIGQGDAVQDVEFRNYLCAVADWRVIRTPPNKPRINMRLWKDFLSDFGNLYNTEPMWRRNLISETCDYYTDGTLPFWLPGLDRGLPSKFLICESVDGKKFIPSGDGTTRPAQSDKRKIVPAPVPRD